MAERKNTNFDRPGGYAMPIQRKAAGVYREAGENQEIRLLGDRVPPYEPEAVPGDREAGTESTVSGNGKKTKKQSSRGTSVRSTHSESDGGLQPAYSLDDPDTRVYLGDCRDVLAQLKSDDPEQQVDLIFADPPFNWDVPYDEWKDGMPRAEYERFTFDWLDGCINVLAPHGALWVNIPDDTAAEIVVHLKRRGLTMINWCIWHFRFGQNRDSSFIMSKVHALYFVKDPDLRIWNPDEVLELSDRAAIYGDHRTLAKASNKGMRVPMDVWYGKHWGRIQGNNFERRPRHHNQIPEVYLERVIRACSKEGSLVLDPFLGSGTTCTVARELNRRSIGIEYGRGNAASAFERICNGAVRVKRDRGAPESSALFETRRQLNLDEQPRKKRRSRKGAVAGDQHELV